VSPYGPPVPLRTSSSQRSPTLEEFQVLQERFFSHEKQFHTMLLAQQKTLQLQEIRLQDLESRDRGNGNGHAANGAGPVNGFLDVKEQQERQDLTIEQLSKRAEEFNKIAENMPEVLDRAAAVERRQETLEEEYHAQCKIIADLDSRQRSMSEKKPDMTEEEAIRFTKNLEKENSYVLNNSVWDLLLFIGTSELRKANSIFSILLAIFNIILQLGFCMVCIVNFMQGDLNRRDVEAATYFRKTFSHDVRFMNSAQESLASRLCDMQKHPDLELDMATAQRTTLAAVEDYLLTRESDLMGIFDGRAMCKLALFCWTLTILKELKEIMNFSSAAFNLPRAHGNHHTHIRVVNHPSTEDIMLEFKNISAFRLLLVSLSIMLRTFVAGTLLFVGCNWLSTTVAVEEILLNAIALEFIMQLDELVFEAFAPGHAVALIESFKPLERPRWASIVGLEIRSVYFLVLAITNTLVFYFFKTDFMVQTMKDIKSALCDEPLDFMYGVDSFGFVHLEAGSSENTNTAFIQQAVEEALATKSTSTLETSSFTSALNTKSLWESISLSEIVVKDMIDLIDLYNPECRDILQAPNIPYSNVLLQFMKQVYEVDACDKSILNKCTDYDSDVGRIVRAFCSETCGCTRPDSDLPSIRPTHGCPSYCPTHDSYLRTRENAICYNTPLADLQASTYWPSWVDYLKQKETFYPEAATALETFGCDFMNNLTVDPQTVLRQLCKGNLKSGLKSIAIACPVTCRCHESDFRAEYCAAGNSDGWCLCREFVENWYNQSAYPISNPLNPQPTLSDWELDCNALVCGEKSATLQITVWRSAKSNFEVKFEDTLNISHDTVCHPEIEGGKMSPGPSPTPEGLSQGSHSQGQSQGSQPPTSTPTPGQSQKSQSKGQSQGSQPQGQSQADDNGDGDNSD